MRLLIVIVFVIAVWPCQGPGCCHAQIDYARDIQPLLAEHCYACHGPDENTREAGLRLDERDSVLAQLDSGVTAVVPGDVDQSELVARVFDSNPGVRMPPIDEGNPLSEEQKRLLLDWVTQGAEFTKHWAFVPPRRLDVPNVDALELGANRKASNAIDHFVINRVTKHGLSLSESADKTTLIRRLSLDLRGLPPTIEEIDEYLADHSEDAYEQLVDRMLGSIHFGEKLALDWLDLARYGDTNGYHNDSHRDMWLYRDWLIHAFHTNMPYDQFVREQLAGDLLPDATPDQIIASAFNRNAPFNEEGGADPDEFFVAYAVDRANTTGQGLLGLTFGCAQCHSHKYDPITQKEYYEFLAFFNSVEGEIGGGGENGHHNKPVPPTAGAQSPLRHIQAAQLEVEIENADERYSQLLERAIANTSGHADLNEWLVEARGRITRENQSLPSIDGLVLHLDSTDINGNGTTDIDEDWTPPSPLDRWIDRSSGLEAEANSNVQLLNDAIGGYAAVRFDGEQSFLLARTGGQRLAGEFTIFTVHRVWRNKGHQMLVMWGDESNGKRRSLWVTDQSLKHSFNGYHADVIGDQSLEINKPVISIITKSGDDHLIQLGLNGELAGDGKAPLESFENDAITIGANNAGNENASVDFGAILIYDRALRPEQQDAVGEYLAHRFSIDASWRGLPEPIAEIVREPTESWNSSQRVQIEKYFVEHVSTEYAEPLRKVKAARDALVDRRNDVLESQSSVMVMRAMSERKPTYVLSRGDFRQPGEEVQPNVPGLFSPLESDGTPDRLELANWMTNPSNPLLSRVRVNHLWKLFFGHGLVRTPGDFGTQGAKPTHPELLDWMAVEFMESGWDTKHLVKLIVMSETYRQDSRIDPAEWTKDPENLWLSRAPRFRLSAEEIRDVALASSGLLNRSIGGPSVRPYQPANYFSSNNGKRWEASSGEDGLRRGMYTYWQRTAPYAAFSVFDAPSRQICTVKRPRTNTPLQALVTLNDPEFQQAARALAKRVLESQNKTDEDRLVDIWRMVLSRYPTERELEILLPILNEQRQAYRDAPDTAADFAGDEVTQGSDIVEFAAWANIALAIINLDEAITRE